MVPIKSLYPFFGLTSSPDKVCQSWADKSQDKGTPFKRDGKTFRKVLVLGGPTVFDHLGRERALLARLSCYLPG